MHEKKIKKLKNNTKSKNSTKIRQIHVNMRTENNFILSFATMTFFNQRKEPTTLVLEK